MLKYIATAICIATPAAAQQCLPLPDALAALASQYAEAPRISGLTANGALMVITASEPGGWSVLLVSPEGEACMVASGTAFELQDAPKPGVDG